MSYVGNGEAHLQETHRKVKRNTMKVKLKDGVSSMDIPRTSGKNKRISSALARSKSVDVEQFPAGLGKYVEEVISKAPSKKEGKL